MFFLLTKHAPDPGGFSAQLCPSCLSPLGTGPQVPVSQVQKSSGGSISWLGVTCQLYHQLDTCRATCGAATCHGSPDIVESGEVSAVELFPGWNAHSFLGALGLHHSRDVNKNTKKKGCIFSLHDLLNNVLQILINCHRRLNASDKSCIFVQP